MISRELWYRRLDEALGHMEDRALQARSWTGIGPEVSSMDEVINGVFDDSLLIEYISLYAHSSKALAAQLRVAVDEVPSEVLERAPQEQLDHPAWKAVRRAAGELRTALRASNVEESREA